MVILNSFRQLVKPTQTSPDFIDASTDTSADKQLGNLRIGSNKCSVINIALKTAKSQHEYYTKLSDFHAQFRMVGNNYNQTLKELKSHFSERRAMALVCKLEKYMMQLVQIMQKVVEITNKYQEQQTNKRE